MSLFTTLARAVARSVFKVAKKQTGSCNHFCSLTQEVLNQGPLLRIVKTHHHKAWFNFTRLGFFYNGLAADLRRKAFQRFLLRSRNESKLPLFAFTGGLILANSNFNDEKGNAPMQNDARRYLTYFSNGTVFPTGLSQPTFNETLKQPCSGVDIRDAVDLDENEDVSCVTSNYHNNIPNSTISSSEALCEIKQRNDFSNNNDSHSIIEQLFKVKFNDEIVDDFPLTCVDLIETYSIYTPVSCQVDNCTEKNVYSRRNPKNCSSLKAYLYEKKDIKKEICISLFHQLLGGIFHLEKVKISLQSLLLKSENIFVDKEDISSGHVFVSHFDQFIAEKKSPKLFSTDSVKKNGKFVEAGLNLSHLSDNAWCCGSIGYEIFNQGNPLINIYLQSTEYENVFDEIPIYSGKLLIDRVIRGLLQNDLSIRLSASQAFIIMSIIQYSPPKWLIPTNLVTRQDIENWLIMMKSDYESKLNDSLRSFSPDILLKSLFLSRVSSNDILCALVLAQKLKIF